MDWRDALSGSIGAFCCIATGQPFDVVKARLQASADARSRKGPVGVAVDCVSKEGFRGLFKGFSPALMSAVTENVVVWSVNSFLRDAAVGADLANLDLDVDFDFGFDPDAANGRKQALLGALTGCVSAVAICPAEVIKVRLQMSTARKRLSPVTATVNLVRQSGPLGLFKGLGALLLRDVPFYFLFFGAMESFWDHFDPARSEVSCSGDEPVPEPSLLMSAIGGGLAGSFAWAVVFPIDVAKTRQQYSAGKFGIKQTLSEIIEKEGLTGLYRGWTPAVVRALPANGSLVFGVHLAKKLLSAE